MEQLRKDHPLHRNMCYSWNILVCSANSSGHPSGRVIKSLPAVMHTEWYISAQNRKNKLRHLYCVYTASYTYTMVIVTSVWSVQLFKIMSIQQKIQDYNTLSKKLLFMPILMMILVAWSVLSNHTALFQHEAKKQLENISYFTKKSNRVDPEIITVQ